MHILAISCSYHDAAAALLRGGVLGAAAQEKRLGTDKQARDGEVR
jgi:predicted NodU family carbamoyl transferase